jgi:hypothetical protein
MRSWELLCARSKEERRMRGAVYGSGERCAWTAGGEEGDADEARKVEFWTA